jgi:MATE family multidrug resistance protein
VSGVSFRPTRDDLRALLRLALPLVAVQVGQMAMGVVDTLMVGRVSGAAMASAALGNIYSFGLVLVGMGTLLILDPLISQAVGAGDAPAASRAMQRGLVLATLLTVPIALLHVPAEAVLRRFDQKPEVVPVAASFVHASILGIAPFLYVTVMRQALQARHRIRPLLVAMLVANVVNAGLNWVFIWGHLGVPALGAAGSGLSTSLSRWFLALFLAALSWTELRPMLVPWRREAFDAAALRRIVALGAPIGLQLAFEVGVFNVAGLLIGRIGTAALAGHQVALNLASLTFMVPLGVAMAASVLVGNAIGRRDAAAARKAAGAGLLVGTGFMACTGAVFLTCSTALALLYNAETDVVATASALIAIAGVFQVFDGVQCVASGILRGAGESRMPAAANLAGYWVLGLPIGCWLKAERDMGAAGLWWGLTVGLAVVAALLLWRTFHVLSGDVGRIDVDSPKAAAAPPP